MFEFPSINDILQIHENQIRFHGGSTGIRDLGLLESALAMPQASFGGHYLHADVYEMAAAYLFILFQIIRFLTATNEQGPLRHCFFWI